MPSDANHALETTSGLEKRHVKFTLVRHSAYGINRDADFRHAVEEHAIVDGMIPRILKAGGLIFDTYKEAFDAAQAYNYPPGTQALIPQAQGEFKNVGSVRAVFIPFPKP